MKKRFFAFPLVIFLFLSACGAQQDNLVDMSSTSVDGKYAVTWGDRTYVIFCVVSKNDRGAQLGYVDGDTDNRISEYKGYSSNEWIVSWLPMDGGAMLLKEQTVMDIPDGLEAEY